MEWLSSPDAWVALLTLTILEIVLGIDNIIFISILVDRLPPERQNAGRKVGLGLAVITRILLLLSIAWITRLTDPLFTVPVVHHDVSGRDLILLVGGLFLIAKSTHEIHHKLEEEEGHGERGQVSFVSVIAQILMLDVVFSLDSVITAVGMADHVEVMIAAVIISVGIMLWAAEGIGTFVNRHPSIKMLALSFLLLIGVSLIGESFGHHLPKGYIYSAMAFSAFVETLNLRAGSRNKPVALRESYLSKDEVPGASCEI